MVKKRSAESYTGNTPEAKRRQRLNLIPGNVWDKRHRKELKLNCWWWTLPLGNMQDIYEIWTNERGIEDTPKEELKSEDFLDDVWWENLTIENKAYIIKICDGTYRAEDEEEHKKQIDKCLQEQIKEEKLELEKVRSK
ncbi:unnamed protein product [marine sediment metagenome]|uniref:Uncharacterized protein n=1 Tax=marine sediment metagenome TaxID=412755 RepID=X1S877_9ZZZZ